MVRFHIVNIENVRDGYIARVAVEKIRYKGGPGDPVNHLRQGKQVRGGNIQRAKRIHPAEGLGQRTLDSAFAIISRKEGMQAARERRDFREANQDLVKQMRAALGEGYAEQDRPAGLRFRKGCKANGLKGFLAIVYNGPDR